MLIYETWLKPGDTFTFTTKRRKQKRLHKKSTHCYHYYVAFEISLLISFFFYPCTLLAVILGNTRNFRMYFFAQENSSYVCIVLLRHIFLTFEPTNGFWRILRYFFFTNLTKVGKSSNLTLRNNFSVSGRNFHCHCLGYCGYVTSTYMYLQNGDCTKTM